MAGLFPGPAPDCQRVIFSLPLASSLRASKGGRQEGGGGRAHPVLLSHLVWPASHFFPVVPLLELKPRKGATLSGVGDSCLPRVNVVGTHGSQPSRRSSSLLGDEHVTEAGLCGHPLHAGLDKGAY